MSPYIEFAGEARTIPLFILEWLFVFVGVIGNIVVIILVGFYDGIKKPVNKLLFINLAVADVGFLLIRHPFNFMELLYIKPYYGVFTCEFLEPISMAFFPASLLIIFTISYYRHQAIVHLARSELSMKKAAVIVVSIWVFMFTFYPARRIPFSKLLNNTTRTECTHAVPEDVHTAIRIAELGLLYSFFFGNVILFLRMRRTLLNSSKFNANLRISLRINQNLKTIRVLKPVIVVLFFTLSPISALDIYRIVQKHPKIDFKDYLLLHHLFAAVMLVNSAANPFIYTFASREFRVSLQKLMKLRWSSKNRITPPINNYTVRQSSSRTQTQELAT